MHSKSRRTTTKPIGIAGPLSMAILAVGLGGLALGVPGAWLAFPVGYGVVLPMAIRWHRNSESSGGVGPAERGRDEDDEALATLRERYARGELDDAAFEDRVERLVETEERPGYTASDRSSSHAPRGR